MKWFNTNRWVIFSILVVSALLHVWYWKSHSTSQVCAPAESSSFSSNVAYKCGDLFVKETTSSFDTSEGAFINLDSLTKKEINYLKDKSRSGEISEITGSFVIIFPDGRLPLYGEKAEKMILSGQVKTATFGGVINTFMGSMHLAKTMAIKNNEPIIAVHSGSGEMAAFSASPTAFYVERTYNRRNEKFYDSAIDPILDVFKKIDPKKIEELNLIGYCLGSFKSANLAFLLREQNPELLKKMNIYTLGATVNFPPELNWVYQVMGNKDQFGRINSTNPMNADDVMLGQGHPIRTDRAGSLDVLSLKEVEKNIALRKLFSNDGKLKKLSDEVIRNYIKEFSKQIENYDKFSDEARKISNSQYSDRIHDLKLKYERSRFIVYQAQLEIILFERKENTENDIKNVQIRIENEQNSMKKNYDEMNRLNEQRNVFTDMTEYQWYQFRKLTP